MRNQLLTEEDLAEIEFRLAENHSHEICLLIGAEPVHRDCPCSCHKPDPFMNVTVVTTHGAL